MPRRICLGLAACFAVTGVAAAKNAVAPAAAPVAASGTITIQLSLQASPSLPDGAILTLNPSISVSDASYSYNTTVVPRTVTVSGRKANVTLALPYAWDLLSRSDQVSVSVYVSGDVHNGVTDSGNFIANFAVPANGANTVVTFSGSL